MLFPAGDGRPDRGIPAAGRMDITDAPIWVRDSRTMRRLLDVLGRSDRIAVDSESNPMHAYRELLCLLQITAGGRDWFVDPLAGLDLGPLGEMFEDPGLMKVFHDAEYDLYLLRRTHGIRVRGLYDTKVVAVALGNSSVGLAGMLASELGIELDKKQQLSDWSRRPLTPEQEDYARRDTHYLLDLQEALEAKLARAPSLVRNEVRSEFRRLENLEPPDLEERRKTGWKRVKGAGKLNPEELRVLERLFLWREGAADARNVPPFKVCSDRHLLEVAKSRPQSRGELVRSCGIPEKIARRIGGDLLAVVKEAEGMPGLEFPQTRRSGKERAKAREVEAILDALKAWRKERAGRRPTDPSHILNREIMEALASWRPVPETLEDLESTGLLESWRIEAYGGEILAALEEGAGRGGAGNEAGTPRRRRRRQG